MKETPRQRAGFEVWYAAGRSAQKTAEKLSVSERQVYEWARQFCWHERADARDIEAGRQTEAAAITAQAQRLEEHRQAGELLRRRGVQYLVGHPIDNAKDAIAAIKAGVELERLSMGLPNWVFEVLRMDDEQLERERQSLIRMAAQEVGMAPLGLGEDEADDEEPEA
jgi:hypothetical protein